MDDVERKTRGVLDRWARKSEGPNSTGAPMVCLPPGGGRAEPYGKRVIFPDLHSALSAGFELDSIYTDVFQEPYPCPQSRHGHYHLRTLKRER